MVQQDALLSSYGINVLGLSLLICVHQFSKGAIFAHPFSHWLGQVCTARFQIDVYVVLHHMVCRTKPKAIFCVSSTKYLIQEWFHPTGISASCVWRFSSRSRCPPRKLPNTIFFDHWMAYCLPPKARSTTPMKTPKSIRAGDAEELAKLCALPGLLDPGCDSLIYPSRLISAEVVNFCRQRQHDHQQSCPLTWDTCNACWR